MVGCDSGPGPNEVPTVDFGFSPNNPRAENAVTFNADATDTDGSIQGYEWSTSDGAEGQGPSFSYAFPEQGSYTVTLTVTDNRGGTATASQTVEVRQRYTEVTVEEVTVQEMPFTNDSGQGWDTFSGPDVYLRSFNVTEDVLAAVSELRYDNVGPSDLPLVYSQFSFTVNDLSNEFSINMIDSDTNDNEFIGGVSYKFDELVGDYPENVTLQFQDITYEVSLDWSE